VNGRALAVRALLANPALRLSDEVRARFADPRSDVAFDELDMDSLARMELSIWLEVNLGLAVTEERILAMKSMAGLARYLQESGRVLEADDHP
jgi:acyl carrier protein